MHEKHGMAHRDVKPLNILLGADGSVKLGDLGLSGDATVAKSGYTPNYAAPELLGTGSAGTIDTDVYAFGVTVLVVSGWGFAFSCFVCLQCIVSFLNNKLTLHINRS